LRVEVELQPVAGLVDDEREPTALLAYSRGAERFSLGGGIM
jgi:hypothetical protein